MNTSNFISLYSQKISSVRKTAYIRFDLSERLQIINYINLVTSLLLTTYLAGWAIFIAFFPESLSASDRNIVSYIAVMATIALMLLTALDYVADRSLKAKIFLDSGNDLLQIADDLEYAVNQGNQDHSLKVLIDNYNSHLKECPLNHSAEDYKFYMLKQERRASKGFKKSVCSSAALLTFAFMYYAKRTSLQFLVAAMVVIPTLSMVSKITL